MLECDGAFCTASPRFGAVFWLEAFFGVGWTINRTIGVGTAIVKEPVVKGCTNEVSHIPSWKSPKLKDQREEAKIGSLAELPPIKISGLLGWWLARSRSHSPFLWILFHCWRWLSPCYDKLCVWNPHRCTTGINMSVFL